MKCQRCFAELPKQAQFCLRCGTPVAGTATGSTAAGVPGDVPRSSNRSLLAIVALLSLLVVGLGAMVVKNGLTQKAGQSGASTGLVQAPGQSGGPNNLVQAPAEAPPSSPFVQQPGDTAPAPVEIVDYLRFVGQCEATKQRIIHDTDRDLKSIIATLPADQLKAMMKDSDNPGPSSDPAAATQGATQASKIADDTQKQFDDLTRQFQAKQPPGSCAALRDAYYSHLGKLEARLLQAIGIMNKISSDPQTALTEIQDMQSKDLDNDAQVANDAKNSICTTYHIQSTFDIKGDESQSDLFK